nr:FAD-dependent oxidoreductase [Corynebacterium auriscanis]
MRTFQHVIIGAGIIGLTTALELVREGVPGQSIAVVDPAPISGASWVAGGMLAPVAEVQYGQEALYPLMMRSAELWPDLIAFVRRLSDLPTGFRDEST